MDPFALSPYALGMATEAVRLKKSGAASQRIAGELSQRILGGDLAPGTRIRQEQIAEEFGVSRLPIREALRSIETMDRLTQLAREMENCQVVEDFVELDREFHLLSFQDAGMPTLLEMVERLWNTTQHYRRAYVQLIGPEGLEDTNLEHRLLLA